MKKKFLAGLVIGLFVLGMAGMAQATLVVYHDRASFLADAGYTAVHDFESDSVGFIRPPSHYYQSHPEDVRDFGDFTIDSTSTGIYLSEVRDNNYANPGNTDIYMNSYDNTASLKVIFNSDVSAFGFDWIAEGNDYWDISTFSFDGTTWNLGTPGDSGFLGLVENSGTIGAGTAFSFGQSSRSPGPWSGVSFDNVTYSSNGPAPVPEPTTLLLLGTGLIGLAGCLKRKKIFRPSISGDPNARLASRA